MVFPTKEQRENKGLTEVRRFTTDLGEFVICKDVNGQEWIVPDATFKKCRYSGFPFLPENIEDDLRRITAKYKWYESNEEAAEMVAEYLNSIMKS